MSDDAFDRLIELSDPPMLIVTVSARGRNDGCLVGFHSQCSIQPLRYAVWLSKANLTTEIAFEAEHLGVHVLTDRDHELADLFGSETGDVVDKLGFVEWSVGPDGVPLLDDCPNRFVGRRTAVVEDDSDHVCFVLEPIASNATDDRGRCLRWTDVTDVEPGHEATERRHGSPNSGGAGRPVSPA